jgi:PAS domain-containing protein
MIRADSLTGSGTITADGLSANTADTTPDNDGGGGGGAGGTIVVVSAGGTLAGLTAEVNGGVGGYANLAAPPAPAPGPGCLSGTAHGPGGGGGGGVVLLSAAPGTSVLTGGANGLTNVTSGVHNSTTQDYGAADGANGIIATNLTRASVPGVETCLASTRASIAGLRVEPSGTVEFVTSLQRGTVGFNVYGLGRRRDTTWTRLNDHLVTSPMPDSLAPIFYRVETDPITARFLMIEEIERHGRRRLSGPFSVTDTALREAYELVEARVEAAGRPMRERLGARFAGAREKVRTPRRPGPSYRREADRRGNVSGVKVEVPARGTVTLPLAELAAQGLSVAEPRRLRVWNAGRSVVSRLTWQDGSHVLRFEVEALVSDYTDRNVYVVTGLAAPPAPVLSFTRSGPAPMPGGVTVEQDSLYAPFLPREADPWIWDFLVSGSPAGPYLFDLPPAPAAGSPVGVRVLVTGLTGHVHTVEAALNGVAVGRVTFTSQAAAEILGSVPAESLRATGNELTLTHTAEASVPEDVGLAVLDRVEVGVARGPATAPVSYALSPYDATLPDIGEVNYLVVTHALFRAQADAVAALKAAEGYRPLVVDVARAYDRFSAGVFEGAAVKALIRHVARRAPLRYVLLVGDDTFDYRDRMGLGLASYVPSLVGWDGEFGRVPSENRFADLDDDGRPDVAIGRLPVQTVEEADVLVDKIARQSAVLAAAQGPHVIAVDNDGPGDALFHAEAESLAVRLPSVAWADLAGGLGQARGALLGGLAAGAPTTHYFGHGGHERWADEGLLTSADVAALAGSNAESVLFTWACEVQWYQYDWGPTLNEALLLTPQGGALAVVGPTGITDPAYQSPFHKRMYAHFLAGVPLGEALRRAKAEVVELSPAFEPVAEGWSLLGDPALKLP